MDRRTTLAISLVLAIAAVALTPAAGGARAADAGAPKEAPDQAVAQVKEVVDGDTLVLDRDILGSNQVRLVGIQAPKLALGRPGFQDWPLAREAKAALAGLADGRLVRLHFTGHPRDRHRRLLAHLHREDGLWLQGEMVRQGMARVYSFPDNRARLGDLLAIERQARADRRGIWAHPFYAVRDPAGVGGAEETFHIVEGKVIDAQRRGDWVYLNFGPDWRSDFTVGVEKDFEPSFRKEGMDVLALKGKSVRVRGWVYDRNGPFIDVTHPEQIEVLPSP